MKYPWMLFLLIALLVSCVERETPCPAPEEQWVAVGFYRSGTQPNRWDVLPLDTTFRSVYALGTQAELGQRRIENFFLLPIPLIGGEVAYVFKQQDRQDTLRLSITTQMVLNANACGLQVVPIAVDVLSPAPALSADSIRTGFYFPYDDPKLFASSLAVFVP